MKMKFYRPSAELRDFVNFYWIFEAVEKLGNPATHRIIPNGCIELIFHFGDPVFQLNEANISLALPGAILKGQLNSFYDIQYSGRPHFLSVLFKPHGARMFFDIPMNLILGENIDLNLLIGNDSSRLADKLYSQDSNKARVAIVEGFLLQRLASKKLYNFKRINVGMQHIKPEAIVNRIDPLSSAACLSNKQFDRVFLEFTGMNPKQFLQVVRMQQLMHRLHTGRYFTLTDLAVSCGYFDQAHCIKEVKRYTGYTPLQLSVQDIQASDLFLKV